MGAANCATECCAPATGPEQQVDVTPACVAVCAEDWRVRVADVSAAADKSGRRGGEPAGDPAQTLLQSGVQQTIGGAKVAESSSAEVARQAAPSAGRTFEFEIGKLERTEKLGLDVGHNNGVLIVSTIFADGAVARVNAAARARNPCGEVLKIGDIIERVNGVEGDDDAMVDACRASERPVLCVRRREEHSVGLVIAGAGASR